MVSSLFFWQKLSSFTVLWWQSEIVTFANCFSRLHSVITWNISNYWRISCKGSILRTSSWNKEAFAGRTFSYWMIIRHLFSCRELQKLQAQIKRKLVHTISNAKKALFILFSSLALWSDILKVIISEIPEIYSLRISQVIIADFLWIIIIDSFRKVFKSVADDWSSLKGKSIKECVHGYLHLAQAIPLYGSKLFKAQVITYSTSRFHWPGETRKKIDPNVIPGGKKCLEISFPSEKYISSPLGKIRI